MQTETQARFERLLLDLQVTLQAEIAQGEAEAAPVQVDGTMGRVSRGDAMQVQQMALEAKRRREQRLLRVGSALQRLRDGEYGRCGRCDGSIDVARLEAMPEVVLCVRCAATPSR